MNEDPRLVNGGLRSLYVYSQCSHVQLSPQSQFSQVQLGLLHAEFSAEFSELSDMLTSLPSRRVHQGFEVGV